MFHSIIRDVQQKSDIPQFKFDQYCVFIFPWEREEFIDLKKINIKNDLKGVLYSQSNEKYIELICAFEIFKTPLFGILQFEKESKILYCYLGFDMFTFFIFIYNIFKIPQDILQILMLEMYKAVKTPCLSVFQFYHTQQLVINLLKEDNNHRDVDTLTETLKLNLINNNKNEEFIKHLSRYIILLKTGFLHYNESITIS